MHRCKGGPPVARDNAGQPPPNVESDYALARHSNVALAVESRNSTPSSARRGFGRMLFAEVLIAAYSVIFSVLIFEMLAVKKR
jgi:hypothetical protein